MTGGRLPCSRLGCVSAASAGRRAGRRVAGSAPPSRECVRPARQFVSAVAPASRWSAPAPAARLLLARGAAGRPRRAARRRIPIDADTADQQPIEHEQADAIPGRRRSLAAPQTVGIETSLAIHSAIACSLCSRGTASARARSSSSTRQTSDRVLAAVLMNALSQTASCL